MNELSAQRTLLFSSLAAVALLVPYPLLNDALRVYNSSEAALVARLYGAAFEDVFGFGYWFTWAIFAFLEAFAVAAGWLVAKGHRLRYLLLIPLAAFVAISGFSYRSHVVEYSLWFKRP